MYLWRAIDQNGEVLDVLVQVKRDTKAALKLMRRLLKQIEQPDVWKFGTPLISHPLLSK